MAALAVNPLRLAWWWKSQISKSVQDLHRKVIRRFNESPAVLTVCQLFTDEADTRVGVDGATEVGSTSVAVAIISIITMVIGSVNNGQTRQLLHPKKWRLHQLSRDLVPQFLVSP